MTLRFLPALVRTYNAGLSFALLFLFLFLLVRTHYSEYCIFVQFQHIALNHCMHPCPAALPGSLARQLCPVALPGSLARHPCRAALQKHYKINKMPYIA
jgi:hypothetical protein